jgi:GNAT superfamily N-acetyltransferase
MVCGDGMKNLRPFGVDADAVAVVPAADEHYEFSYQVKKAAEGDLIARTFGWDEVFQRQFHLEEWSERRPSLITVGGRPVGTIEVGEEETAVHIRQFFILPEFQNLGIGAEILGRALRRADEKQVVATLAFLVGNRCQSLYRRHGFEVVSQGGSLCRMERRPR